MDWCFHRMKIFIIDLLRRNSHEDLVCVRLKVIFTKFRLKIFSMWVEENSSAKFLFFSRILPADLLIKLTNYDHRMSMVQINRPLLDECYLELLISTTISSQLMMLTESKMKIDVTRIFLSWLCLRKVLLWQFLGESN